MENAIKRFDFQSDKILKALPKQDRELFLEKAVKLNFKSGKLIFYEGGIPTGAFIIVSGKAKIYKTGMDGKDQIFYIYKEGDLLGYHALLCNEKYEDACEVMEDSELLFISKQDFDELLLQIGQLKSLLIANMGHEFGVLVNTITVLAQKPLRERLALNLFLLHHKYQKKDERKVAISLPREDLANIVGTARESLGRLLKDFKEDGLIDIEKRAIFIKDMKKLFRVAAL